MAPAINRKKKIKRNFFSKLTFGIYKINVEYDTKLKEIVRYSQYRPQDDNESKRNF